MRNVNRRAGRVLSRAVGIATRPSGDDVRQVAIYLFRRDGFDAVTVEDVAVAAGVSPSTIYRHFGTKDALVLPVGAPDALVQAYTKAAAKHTNNSTSRLFRRAAVRVYDDVATERLAMIAADAALTDAFERELLAARATLAAAVAASRGRAHGIGDDADAAALLGALAVLVLGWARGHGAMSLNKTLSRSLPDIS